MKHQFKCQVRWGDLDAFMHVNNAAYLTYIQEARVDFTVYSRQRANLQPVLIEMVVAHADIDYINPIYDAGIEIDIAVWVSKIGTSSFVLQYELSKNGEVYAKAKTVQVYDLKCTWSVENFYSEYYLYRRAYIQGYLYHQGAGFWASEMGYGDYTILFPKFIVCDSTNYMNPLVYAMGQDSINNAFDGFEYKGREYPGVAQLIEDLKWALDNDVWNISRENHINNGVVKLG